MTAWRQGLVRLLTWRRARTYALVLVVLYVVAWVDVVVQGNWPLNSSGTPIAGDYIAFHTAGRLVLSGQAAQLYDRAPVVAVQDELLHGSVPGFYDAYRNPPFFALIYAPLAGLDLLWGYAAWFVLSVAALGLAIKLLLDLDETRALRPRWRGLLVLVFAFAPLYFGLIDGENATLSLLLYVLVYRSFARGEDRALGVWAALGLFKPQLFVVFPLVFLLTGRWRSLVTYTLTALTLFAVSFALVGADGMQAWARILLEPEGGNALANGWRMASAKSFFDALLPGLSLLSLFSYLLVSVGLLLLLWQLWRRPVVARIDLPIAFALTSLVAVLINPHLVDYDLTVLVAAGILTATLLPRYALVVLPLYAVTLLRAQIPLTDTVGLQLTAPLLLLLTVWLYRESRPIAVARDASPEPTSQTLAPATHA